MLSRFWYLVASMVLLTTLLVSACTSPSPATAPKSSSPPATTSASATTPVAKPTSASIDTFELKFAVHFAATYVFSTGALVPFINEVESKSNGRIKITPYYSETLGKNANQYDMVAQGIADFSWVNPSNTPGRFPLSEILNLSFAFKNATDGASIATKMRPHLEQEFKDVKILTMGSAGVNAMGFKNKRVDKLEDLNGMKVRTMGGIMSETLSLLGGVPVALATADQYIALFNRPLCIA